jgi:hypothetical protein
MAKSRPLQNQSERTGFELSYGTCWDLRPELLQLYLPCVVCALSIEDCLQFMDTLNLLFDTLDIK